MFNGVWADRERLFFLLFFFWGGGWAAPAALDNPKRGGPPTFWNGFPGRDVLRAQNSTIRSTRKHVDVFQNLLGQDFERDYMMRNQPDPGTNTPSPPRQN